MPAIDSCAPNGVAAGTAVDDYTWSFASLAPGDEVVCTLKPYAVDPKDVDAANAQPPGPDPYCIENWATAQAEPSTGMGALYRESPVCSPVDVPVASPQLTLTKVVITGPNGAVVPKPVAHKTRTPRRAAEGARFLLW